MTTVRTNKQMAAGHRRSLKAMKRKLVDMAAEWGEVDAFNEGALEDLARLVEEVAGKLTADE